jgi:N-acetylneuraminic acid mutarotase
MGGFTGTAVNHQIFALRKTHGRYVWSAFGSLDANRVFASAVSVGHKIYLVGGTSAFEAMDAAGTCCTTRTATNSMMKLDLDHPAAGWKQLRPFPGYPLWYPAIAADDKAIWLFGGSSRRDAADPAKYFDGVLRYIFQTGEWDIRPPLPKEIAGQQPLTALAEDDGVLLFSGQKAVWRLDLGTQRYAETTPMPEAVAVGQFFWLNQEIIGAGGESEIEGPRRRSPWTFVARVISANSSH